MGRRTHHKHNRGNGRGSSTGGTLSFEDFCAEILRFGTRLASLDCSHLAGQHLHKLVKLLAGLETQIALCRANVLAEIKRQGGDPIDSQKRNGKASHSASKKNADTAAGLNKLPGVKKKMANGNGMTANKASLLAGAAKKTGADDVNTDNTLLDKVEKQDEDQAKATIAKWVRDRQSGEQRKSQRQKNIDARQFWMFIKDGMVHSHGKAPADVRNMALFRRWEAEKSRLWRLDGGRETAHQSIRSDEQRGADAYANVLDGIDGQPGGMRDHADWCADVDNTPNPAPAPNPAPEAPTRPEPQPTNQPAPAPAAPVPTPASASTSVPVPPSPAAPPPGATSSTASSNSAPPRSRIVIVAHAENLDTDDADVMADIVNGGPLLRSELALQMCHAEIHGVLFDASGLNPLWAGRGLRHCTDAQWVALLVRDGGCVLTGADPSHCEAHHVIPFQAPAKGRTDITNLVMVSTSVHHWLHDNKLTIFRKPDGTWDTRPATPEEIAPRGRRPKSEKSEPDEARDHRATSESISNVDGRVGSSLSHGES